MQPTLIAIETSTVACSAALLYQGNITERYITEPRQHAFRLLPFIDELLIEAGISLCQCDAIAFGAGPGSFTGARIAVSVAQGLAYGCGKPVVSVSSLNALAQSVYRLHHAHEVLIAMDARMQEVYVGHYRVDELGIMRALCDDSLVAAEQFSFPCSLELQYVGDGWQTYDILKKKINELSLKNINSEIYPHAFDVAVLAADLFKLGKKIDPQLATPTYLRDKVTHGS